MGFASKQSPRRPPRARRAHGRDDGTLCRQPDSVTAALGRASPDAGVELMAECRTVGGCRPGEAKIPRAYRLPARFVIHTVGPVWKGGKQHEPEILANCYRSSLQLAVENRIKSIAFPAISCGAYGYPIPEAAQIAVKTTRDFLTTQNQLDKVIF